MSFLGLMSQTQPKIDVVRFTRYIKRHIRFHGVQVRFWLGSVLIAVNFVSQ